MLNEVWSPVVPITGLGSEYIIQFLSYRDLSLNALVFYVWGLRDRVNLAGCPSAWKDLNFVYYGGQKDWIGQSIQVGALVQAGATHMEFSLGAYDFCGVWGGIYGNCACHSHAPLIDRMKVLHVETYGPQYTYRDIDMWQDNFPELGGVGSTDYARCDMAQDVIPSTKQNLLPGDSLKVVVTDPAGLAAGGNPGRVFQPAGSPPPPTVGNKAVYVFVRCTDRNGVARPYTGLQMQSPDNQAWSTDPNAGVTRWPFAPGVAPAGWFAYQMDQAYTSAGGVVTNTFCADLMDLAAGPDGPPYHPNENWAANTGIFSPGDVINYFIGAKNTLNQWSYIYRNYRGQGGVVRTNNINDAVASPMEWSVLPDAGRLVGDLGDILYVDDSDDRGGPAQIYFDWVWQYYGLEDRVDRYDVLGPSSVVGNSLAGRVKSIPAQMIGLSTEIYQKILWNSSDLSAGLMGDGGAPNGGSSSEKSDDYGLANSFLNNHPNNPGWACWGDDFVTDWNNLIGLGALAVKGTYMNFTLTSGNQATTTGVVSPQVLPVNPLPGGAWLNPVESFYAYGGCAVINDFDVPGQTGNSRVAHKYVNASTGPNASLSQWRVNVVGDTARFFLAGYGFNFIRDDDNVVPPDYAPHLREILRWFQNEIGNPIGIDPVAYENRLDNNYPNPFNPATTIKYSIAERGHVSLAIYNAAGQLVRTLVDDEQVPKEGGFSVSWDGTTNTGGPVASGVYFYRLTAVNFSQTKKMVVLK
jgi:hypothetical protein